MERGDDFAISPKCSSIDTLASGGEFRITEWFAPEVNRYVRRDVELRQGSLLVQSTSESLSDYVRNEGD